MVGWISIHRKFQENWIWKSAEPFDRRSAWLSMLFKANYEDTKAVIDNTLIDIKRGSFVTSESKLAKEWRWGRKKVRTFLDTLENDKMLVKKRVAKYTVITVENWELYQNIESQKSNKRTGEGTNVTIDMTNFSENEEQEKEQEKNSQETKKGTGKGTNVTVDMTKLNGNEEQEKEQKENRKRNTVKQYNNNIYLYLYNKYKVENRKNFNEYMQKTRELRNDEKWNELTKEWQQKLLSEL